MATDPIMKTVQMFHDPYETTNGDGFYPSLNNDLACSSPVDLTFYYVDKSPPIWKSDDRPYPISGLDGDNGVELLTKLNELLPPGTDKAQAIYSGFSQLYPKVSRGYGGGGKKRRSRFVKRRRSVRRKTRRSTRKRY